MVANRPKHIFFIHMCFAQNISKKGLHIAVFTPIGNVTSDKNVIAPKISLDQAFQKRTASRLRVKRIAGAEMQIRELKPTEAAYGNPLLPSEKLSHNRINAKRFINTLPF